MNDILIGYEDYFADVATRHPGLPHINLPARQTKYFAVVEPDDLYGELKNRLDLNKFCLIVDKPELETRANETRQFSTYIQGGIELIRKYSNNSPAAISALQNDALNLMSAIANRIRWQKDYNKFPIGFVKDGFRMVFLHEQKENITGVRLEFTFFIRLKNCDHDPGAWGDV